LKEISPHRAVNRSGSPSSISRLVLLVLVPASQAAAADFPLVVTTDGSGSGTVECDVEGGGAEPCAAEYEEGTELSLVAEPDPGSKFVEFYGDCGPVECELTMDEAHSVTATFEAEEEFFPLVIETAGTGSGTVKCEVEAGPAEPCEEEYLAGTEISLVAEADPGSEFVEWIGDCGPEDCELTMDAEHEAIALFELEPEEFTLEIDFDGTGTGEVECELQEGPEECQETYLEGTEVVLIPKPAGNSEFKEFSGDCGPADCELTMDQDHQVTATFDLKEGAEVTLTITEAGTGEGTVECELEAGPEPCDPEYPAGTELSLVATPESGSEFVGFSGGTGSAAGCSTSPCSFTINANSSVTATFDTEEAESTLTVTTAGTGSGEVKCKFNGGSAGACNGSKANGTTVEIIATANSGSEFAGFSSGTGSASACSTSPCSFTLNANSSVTATFTLIPRTLTITTAGTGSGEVKCKFNGGSAGACTSPQPNGTTVEIIATANSGSTFAGFSGGTGSASSCSTSPCSFTITANSAVTATFTLVSRTLSVTTAGTGSGTVQCKFNGGSAGACTSPQPNGTTVQVIATASSGSEFAGFSGGTGSASSCSTSPCSFTITANSSVTATFNLAPVTEEFALTVNKAGSGSGSVTCDGGACAAKYAKGTKVALAASAASGSTFSGWSGAGCSGTGGCTVTIEGDTSVTATFTADPTPPPPTEGKAKVAATAPVKSGKANLKLTCTGGPCKGTLKLKAKVKQGTKTKTLVIGKGSFSLAEGTTATLKVKLSSPAKKVLGEGKTLKARVSGTGVTSSTVKLKPPKK
jgi:hypothetical protein